MVNISLDFKKWGFFFLNVLFQDLNKNIKLKIDLNYL